MYQSEESLIDDEVFSAEEFSFDVESEADYQLITGAFAKRFHMCKVSDLQIQPMSGGFNTQITGGGIYRLTAVDGKRIHSLSLKAAPTFSSQQEQMFSILDGLGEKEFIDILSTYPSNHLSQREINSYAYLTNKISLRIPDFILGILDLDTEQAWILMEDVSNWSTASINNYEWREKEVDVTVKEMANFHALHWGQDLSSEAWLGRWWTHRNNDFVAFDVTSFALERCAQLHPDVLEGKLLKFLREYLINRESVHHQLLEEPQTIIHWDWGPHNMMFRQSDTTPLVYDWELTSLGVPQWDLAQLLLPVYGKQNHDQIFHLINRYIDYLPAPVKEGLNMSRFCDVFNLVVLDHFYRLCGPVLFSGEEIEPTLPAYVEWQNCISWIQATFLSKDGGRSVSR